MAETGVLRPEARVELVDGQIVDMAPIGPFHGGVTKRLNSLFSAGGRGRWLVSVQDPIRLGDNSEPQPDLMLLKPAVDGYADRHPVPDDVFLLIEVSDSTLEFDRSQKLPAYARAGIGEVWIIDLHAGAVEVYREPNFLGYAVTSVLRGGAVARPLAFPDVGIQVASLLRRAQS